ncbi:MAG: lysophospholipid acyltransferase family protein [Gemmatimonadaceae bacterium]
MSLPDSGSPAVAPDSPQTWQLGSLVPQTNNALLQRVGYACLRLFGWDFAGTFPNHPQFVAVVAPHTSNWDFPILLMAKWALRLDARWMGKDALFRAPLGWFMRAVGGIPIRRGTSHNVVDGSIQAFSMRPQLVLAMAPEGTRKYVADWKSGFWHIARGAGVPIVCVALDFGRKTIRLGPEFFPTDEDSAAGIARIRASYAGVQGRHPELHSELGPL